MKNYISVNVVSQSLLLISAIKRNNCFTRNAVEQLRLPYGVSATTALGFSEQCKWLYEKDGSLAFSNVGAKIERLFNGYSVDPALWRVILGSYVSTCCPAWARRVPYGRKEAFLFMNEEEQRCFLEAGLMESQDDATLKWWDSLAEVERKKTDASKGETGRLGERLTMEYEEQRTGVKPDWRAIETNLCGYDILSRITPSSDDRLLIEVKTSNTSVDGAVAIITRHEWDVASMNNNVNRYAFYFWSITSQKKLLAIIPYHDMRPHIPKDQQSGKWDNVSIPFSAFSDKFHSV